MKKKYMIPQTETVNVRLNSSVLDGTHFGRTSQGIGGENEWNDAKEQSFDDFNSEEDIWGGSKVQMKDVWER